MFFFDFIRLTYLHAIIFYDIFHSIIHAYIFCIITFLMNDALLPLFRGVCLPQQYQMQQLMLYGIHSVFEEYSLYRILLLKCSEYAHDILLCQIYLFCAFTSSTNLYIIGYINILSKRILFTCMTARLKMSKTRDFSTLSCNQTFINKNFFMN